MIWYLLYPLRGTTEPPRLTPSHPIRRAFQAHGTATARHWLLSIVLTITISVLLCYQAIFQSDSSAAAGLRNLPKHVWTSTTEIDGERPADVIVRQVWVHGDYMKAINLPVLKQALLVQEALFGSGFDADRSRVLTTPHLLARDRPRCLDAAAQRNWGWHSPLMYWDCSLHALEEDQDLLATINAHTTTQTSLNLTLRPSTVFAGKRFASSKLRAADALVITFFDHNTSSLGDEWDARARSLASHLSPNWIIFPGDGQATHNRLYEFRFRPMTLSDDLFLAASYFVTAIYVIIRMVQLRAVKSWFGLLVTISAKMTICIIASFTLCTNLGIDLARIPRPWFPAVVFCFGLGNIFRLTNVVLETAPELPPHQRIGNALGEVGHLSLAIAFQNLALLYLCSHLVMPWVADFCVFAAVTLVFDLVFHLTFFVAVLSVDVQRMELSDSLDRIDCSRALRKDRIERQSWFAALREGTLSLGTRFAGTVAIFSMILAINWHFFDSNDKKVSIHTLGQRIVSGRRRRSITNPWDQPPINQARTPGDWLSLQDHNTARELFSFIKPGAHSFIARIYDPLLVVAKGAQGRDRPQPPTSLLECLRRFAHAHAFPAALLLAFLVAGVTLFINYLLWTGLPEASDESQDEDASIFVKTLPSPQTIDVVRLACCSKGHVISVSLDRTTAIWLHGRNGYLHTTLQTATMKPNLWPINATAVNEHGSQLALCSDSGQIGLWNIAASRFTLFPKINLRGQTPILFTFVTLLNRIEAERPYLLIVSPDGYLTELETLTGIHFTRRISPGYIVSADVYISDHNTSLIYVSKPGEVHILPLKEGSIATSEVVAGLDPGPPPGSNPAKIKCLQEVSSLGLIFALRDEEAEVFDFNSRALIYSFPIGHIKPHSFRVLHPARRTCQCGAPAVSSLSVAYNEENTDHMIMQTFTSLGSPTSQVCLGKTPNRDHNQCQRLDSAHEAVHYVEPAGAWEATDALSIIGIRRCMQSPTPSSTISDSNMSHYGANSSALVSALKQRACKPNDPTILSRTFNSTSTSTHIPASDLTGDCEWEAWALSTTGEFRSRPLNPDDVEDVDELANDEDELFVASPGPIKRLGKRSVAVGFGNTVKILTLGQEVFDGLAGIENANEVLDMGLGSYKYRTRKGGNGRKIQ